MASFDLADVVDQNHQALDAFVKGDPEPLGRLYSRREDATLANPFGPPVRGWEQISATMRRAALIYHDGEATGFERISEATTPEMAYIVEVESFRSRLGDAAEVVPFALRVTTVFRIEDDRWRIVHRHADPITTLRPAESILAPN
jgi:ketosteroid isomerase-like protein